MFEFGHPVAVGRITIHSLEDVGAGIAAAAAVHTRRLKAKSCNFSSYLSLPSRGERDWLRSSRESFMPRKESFGILPTSDSVPPWKWLLPKN